MTHDQTIRGETAAAEYTAPQLPDETPTDATAPAIAGQPVPAASRPTPPARRPATSGAYLLEVLRRPAR